MSFIHELTQGLISLVISGALLRIAYYFLKAPNSDNPEIFKYRIIKILEFFLIAALVWQILDLVKYYFPYKPY